MCRFKAGDVRVENIAQPITRLKKSSNSSFVLFVLLTFDFFARCEEFVEEKTGTAG